MRTIDLSRLGIGAVLMVLCAAGWSPAAETVFHYSFDSADGLPVIVDRGPAMNDATAGDAAVLSDETPLEGVPDDAGDSSLDSSAGVTDSTVPSGVVTNNTLLLDNASVAAAGGFTMECWFLWYASAAEMRVNSIIDYAGTEKLTINTNRGNGLVEMQLNNAVFTPVGFVSPLEWHYVAAIFDTEGAAQNDDGTIDGTLRVYLDGIVPTNIVKATKSTFGDSLGRGIGVGTHPMGFASDFFDGLVYEPRVSLGPVALDDLLLQEAEPPTGTGEVFRYSFASTTVLPNIPDASGAGNGATAGGAAALSSDTPDSAPDDGGNRSLNTSGGAGAVTSGTGLLSNDAIESAGGFLMEVWFQWNGGGGVNSIIDYAGTDRIIIDTGNPMAGQVELEMSGAFIPLGIAIPGEWHYVAVIFSSGGRPRIPGGGIEGAVKVFFDQTILPAGFFAALKDTTGDGRNAGIGIGQNPLGGDAFDGLVYEPRVRLGVVGTDLLRYTVPTLEPGTLFKFSFVDGETILPDIEDLGPMGNDAVAGPGAVLVPGDIPTKGVPAGAGDSSLDTSLAAPNLGGEPPSGAVIGNTLLLSNTVVAQAGGFTMEAWVKYNGGGNVNSIIDYAGTEKMTIRGGVVTMQFDQPRRDYPIGTAVTGEWHYAAVVFDTGGAPQNGDGTVTGTVTTYFDSLAPTSVTAGVLKSNYGDSLVRGIGIGQHPLGFGGDFLDGSIFEPKVSLGALPPEDLQLEAAVVQPPQPAFHYSFSEATSLPAIVDQSSAGNDATASGGAVLSAEVAPAEPSWAGNRSLDTAGGGAVTDATGLLDNDVLTSFSGFTMETWLQWQGGGGGVQAIMDYAGTDRLVISGGAVSLAMDGMPVLPIGTAIVGRWHYVAVVFDTLGALPNPDGTVSGTVTAYFDGVGITTSREDVTKSNAGDDLDLGVGLGQSPAGGNVLSGRLFEPRLTLGPLGRDDLSFVMATEPPLAVFRYSFFEDDAELLPDIFDQGSAGNHATAGAAAAYSIDIPEEGVPSDAGDSSLDAAAGVVDPLVWSGAVTNNIDLIANELVALHGGFTMECWFKWNGAGTVNSLLDYAGTEKLVIDRRGLVPPPPLVELLVDPLQRIAIGEPIPGQWHYVAVVFATGGEPVRSDGTITGSVTVYFDSTAPIATTPDVTKSGYGDSLDRGIGLGMHPMGYELDFFDGSIFEPRVTLGPLGPDELLYGGGVTGPRFVRGDADSSGVINITDGIRILSYLFTGGAALECADAGDTDNDGSLTITDAIKVFGYLFLGQGEPAAPAPSNAAYVASDCDVDPAEPASSLGCSKMAAVCGG